MGDTVRTPLNFRPCLLSGNFGVLVPKEERKKGVIILARVIDSDHHPNEIREEYGT